MHPSWLSLLPPIVVIITIIATHQLNISLSVGIITASLIASHGNIYSSLLFIFERCKDHLLDIDNIYLYLALITISSVITLLTVTGGATGFAHIISKKVRTNRGAQAASMLLSTLLSIDDYLSILTVGFVMQPLADRLAVARAKLAYIVHSLAGPLVIIMPISTWAATILAQLDNAGINFETTSKITADPFYVYLKTIPFIFYSLITATSVLFVVLRNISYGPLHTIETKLQSQTTAQPLTDEHENKHSLLEVLLPITILISGVIIGILYGGGYHLLGGNNSFFEAFRQNDKTFLILFIAGLSALITNIFIVLLRKLITITEIPHVIVQGAVLMRGPITMVILASILGSFLRSDLQTGSYIAYLLLGSTPLYLIPVIVFITALIITIATGSAWGTFSLLIPITTQMLLAFLQLETPVTIDSMTILFPTLGALLSGAACGDHISPVSETTIMTGTSTGISALEHARTQFYYALPVTIGTGVAFIVSGLLCNGTLLNNFLYSAGIGICISFALLSLFNKTIKT